MSYSEREIEWQRNAIITWQDFLQVPTYDQINKRTQYHHQHNTAHIEGIFEQICVQLSKCQLFVFGKKK